MHGAAEDAHDSSPTHLPGNGIHRPMIPPRWPGSKVKETLRIVMTGEGRLFHHPLSGMAVVKDLAFGYVLPCLTLTQSTCWCILVESYSGF